MQQATKKKLIPVVAILLVGIAVGGVLSVLWSNTLTSQVTIIQYDDQLYMEKIVDFPTNGFAGGTLTASFNVTEMYPVGSFYFTLLVNSTTDFSTHGKIFFGYKVTDDAGGVIKQELTPSYNYNSLVDGDILLTITSIDTDSNTWYKVEVYMEIPSDFTHAGELMTLTASANS